MLFESSPGGMTGCRQGTVRLLYFCSKANMQMVHAQEHHIANGYNHQPAAGSVLQFGSMALDFQNFSSAFASPPRALPAEVAPPPPPHIGNAMGRPAHVMPGAPPVPSQAPPPRPIAPPGQGCAARSIFPVCLLSKLGRLYLLS